MTAFKDFAPNRSKGATKLIPNQALLIAYTADPDKNEDDQWAILWYRPTRQKKKGAATVLGQGSGFRQYGGKTWYSVKEEAIGRAASLIRERPSLANCELHVQDEPFYPDGVNAEFPPIYKMEVQRPDENGDDGDPLA